MPASCPSRTGSLHAIRQILMNLPSPRQINRTAACPTGSLSAAPLAHERHGRRQITHRPDHGVSTAEHLVRRPGGVSDDWHSCSMGCRDASRTVLDHDTLLRRIAHLCSRMEKQIRLGLAAHDVLGTVDPTSELAMQASSTQGQPHALVRSGGRNARRITLDPQGLDRIGDAIDREKFPLEQFMSLRDRAGTKVRRQRSANLSFDVRLDRRPTSTEVLVIHLVDRDRPAQFGNHRHLDALHEVLAVDQDAITVKDDQPRCSHP